MKLGTEVGLGPGHIVLDRDPAPNQKGQWRSYVGSALRQTFPRRLQGMLKLYPSNVTWGTQAIELTEVRKSTYR